jgi:hypothetical protein
MPLILGTNSVVDDELVPNSLRNQLSTNDFLSRTPTSSRTQDQKYTFSIWFKRSSLGLGRLIQNFKDTNNRAFLDITAENNLFYFDKAGGTVIAERTSNFKLRDTGGWYHYVQAVNNLAGNANSAENVRFKTFLNGVDLSDDWSISTSMGYNVNLGMSQGNDANQFKLGSNESGTGNFDGYFCEYAFFDGQQLVASNFGEFDSDSGIWKPKEYDSDSVNASFGNNGFKLQFKKNGTSANSDGLGADTSGQDNHFTLNNLTAISQSTDTCTNSFCTLNHNAKRPIANGTITEAGLKYTASTGDSSVYGTHAIPPGMKVYFEVKLVNNTAQNSIGIHNLYDGGDGEYVGGGSETGTWSFKPRGAASVTQYFNNGSANNHSVNNASNNTILGVAVDNANGRIHYSLDGTFINSSDPTDNDPAALVTGHDETKEQYLHFSLDTQGAGSEPANQFNFGSPPYSESGGNSDARGNGNFNQQVPSGYFALCTNNISKV